MVLEKLRSIAWADDHNLMIVTSTTAVPWGLVGMPQEWSLLQVYDVSARKIRRIPSGYQLEDIRRHAHDKWRPSRFLDAGKRDRRPGPSSARGS